MRRITGQLLDIYENRQGGLNIFWVLEKTGKRSMFYHRMPIKFFVYGTDSELYKISMFLERQWNSVITLSKEEKIHPFDGEIKFFLSVSTTSYFLHKNIARDIQAFNPKIELYDVGHSLFLYYAAFYNIFAFCNFEFTYNEETKEIVEIHVEDNRWIVDYELPNFKVINFQSNLNLRVEHTHKPIQLLFDNKSIMLDLVDQRKTFEIVSHVLETYDPDVILTDYGDSMILPLIESESARLKKPSFLSRDFQKGVQSIEASTLVSYGRVIHRKKQSLLFGRIHIDRKNMNFYTGLAVETVFEIARISGMGIQEVARSTPGRAVASLEVIEALKSGTCIPYRKQKPEMWRNAEDFLKADRGGMIFQPILGVHENVVSVDFESMFPSIMVKKNLSPETMGKEDAPQGVIPRALEPLLERRLYYKHKAKLLPEKQEIYQARADALKWLLVVSFGYTGFKNAPLTSANIFEQINYWGRESLMEAKDIFEKHEFEVLHVFIDSLFVKHKTIMTKEKVAPLLKEVEDKTDLPIGLEGIYRWVVFLSSKVKQGYAVPNAYFGVFCNGEIKTRGIQCRRHDKPLLVKEAQVQVIQMLAEANDLSDMSVSFSKIFSFVMDFVEDIKNGTLPLERYVISQRLSRNLRDYRVPSHAAQAGQQLFDDGEDVRAGSTVKFIYVKGKPRVLAWDLVSENKGYHIDIGHYLYLLEDAIKTVLIPFGIDEDFIHNLIQFQPMKQLEFLSRSDDLRKFNLPDPDSYYFNF